MRMELRSIDNPLNECAWAQSRHALLRGFFMEEIWKPIPNCNGYLASNIGNIKNDVSGKIYKGHTVGRGYRHVSVIENGVRRYRKVSRLVASAFYGISDLHVLHNNGNPSDDRVENLRYGTPKENYADAVKHGTRPIGDTHGRAIIPQADIKKIKEEYAMGGVTYKQIGERYGVTKYAIYRLMRGDNWKCVS